MDPARVSRRRLARESARPLLALAVALAVAHSTLAVFGFGALVWMLVT